MVTVLPAHLKHLYSYESVAAYLSDGCLCTQALFVEAKLEASKELSQYIDQLNISLEEKRVVFQMARKGPSNNRHVPRVEK